MKQEEVLFLLTLDPLILCGEMENTYNVLLIGIVVQHTEAVELWAKLVASFHGTPFSLKELLTDKYFIQTWALGWHFLENEQGATFKWMNEYIHT